MKDLLLAATEIGAFFDEIHLSYCVIGGLAVQAWGESRVTKDVDLSLLTNFEREAQIIDAILERFMPRYPSAREHALRHRVILVETEGGIGVDIGMAGFPYEEELIGRAKKIEMYPGFTLPVICPEDLLVMKVFANRAIDWKDVSGIITRQGANLDWSLIETNLKPLLELKEAPEGWKELLRVRAEAELA